jgi:hypothetical protein
VITPPIVTIAKKLAVLEDVKESSKNIQENSKQVT